MLNVRIPDDLKDRIDALRGDVPRERWIRRTLESALSAAETREAPRDEYEEVMRAKHAVGRRPLTAEQEAFVAEKVANREPLEAKPLPVEGKPAHAYRPRPKDKR